MKAGVLVTMWVVVFGIGVQAVQPGSASDAHSIRKQLPSRLVLTGQRVNPRRLCVRLAVTCVYPSDAPRLKHPLIVTPGSPGPTFDGSHLNRELQAALAREFPTWQFVEAYEPSDLVIRVNWYYFEPGEFNQVDFDQAGTGGLHGFFWTFKRTPGFANKNDSIDLVGSVITSDLDDFLHRIVDGAKQYLIGNVSRFHE